MTKRDCWAEWLLSRRFGGDPQERPDWVVDLGRVRDRVLDGAKLAGDETVLDVGAGDGLIAFGALERGAREAIFSDISDDLLAHAHQLAIELAVVDRCRFVHASADDLSAIHDASVDVVTTRSVLIYVERKTEAFRAFHRVLRAGGRISLFEPINSFGARFRIEETFWGYAIDGMSDVRDKLNAVYKEVQPPTDPMLAFDERDLVELAVAAGFFPVELDLDVKVVRLEPLRWERFVHSAGNPKIPTLAEAMDEALTAGERERLTAHLRPLVERGDGVGRWATAYLRATKPG